MVLIEGNNHFLDSKTFQFSGALSVLKVLKVLNLSLNPFCIRSVTT